MASVPTNLTEPTAWIDEVRTEASDEPEVIEGRIVDETREWPPLGPNGWPLWLPGTPA